MIVKQGIKKLLDGILKCQTSLQGELRPMFREILDKPKPKSIMLTTVDSRIVASGLFRAEPGAYFMMRNPGNFIPKYDNEDLNDPFIPGNAAASFELACVHNDVDTIAVVGHSDCKTMDLLYSMRNNIADDTDNSALTKWLKTNGKDTIDKFLQFEATDFKKPLVFSECSSNQFEAYIDPNNEFKPREKFSQINTLEQLKNAKNYSFLKDKINQGKVKGYALWLDVQTNDVYLFSYLQKQFVKIDENSYEQLYQEAGAN